MERSSGILLHISSLPNKYCIGTLGKDAYSFVDFLNETGQKLWQILPLGPTGYGNSPYQSFSAFAGNLLLISLDLMKDDGLLDEEDLLNFPKLSAEKVQYDELTGAKRKLMRKAYLRFKDEFESWKEEYYNFLGEHSWWLDDYALFRSLKETDEKICWNEWEDLLRKRDPHQMDVAMISNDEEINYHRFVQFVFFRQWFKLKEYANQKGVQIIGDLPLYVSFDSADVWANQDLFMLDENCEMTQVGGVPPDYFSETGQLWGCPVFNWDKIAERNFDWWVARVHFNLKMFDSVRIDHFRGMESFWAVPAGEKTAINGQWLPAKGYELMQLLKSQLHNLPIIAEDLGVITPEVEKLRDDFNLPGMKVLQFAYATDETNEHLPHNFNPNFVVYTGTHDNDTTLGWLQSAPKDEWKTIRKYLGKNKRKIVKRLIVEAWASVAQRAVIPMQDLLCLDTKSRMNLPGSPSDNWEWRFDWKKLKKSHRKFLKEITTKYNRG